MRKFCLTIFFSSILNDTATIYGLSPYTRYDVAVVLKNSRFKGPRGPVTTMRTSCASKCHFEKVAAEQSFAQSLQLSTKLGDAQIAQMNLNKRFGGLSICNLHKFERRSCSARESVRFGDRKVSVYRFHSRTKYCAILFVKSHSTL